MESKKHYNLSTTEDNGQSITTTNTSTEHPAEILRMMQLAGMETAHMVHQHEESIEEEVDSEFKPTPANDKLDLDDYSKKSPESINKQQKSIQPNHGDNPLEYSIDESEIYEGLMKEFDASEQLAEERVDEFLPLVGAAVGALARGVAGAVIRNPIKSMAAASLLKKNDPEPVNASSKKKGKKLNAVKEEEVNEEQLDELLPLIPMAVGAVAGSLMSSKKSKKKGKKLNAVKEETEELEEAQSPAQKAAFAKMLAAKKGKKDDTVEETTEETTEEVVTEEKVSEDCSCGHDSSCDCSSDCDCGCNAMNEDQIRLAKLVKY